MLNQICQSSPLVPSTCMNISLLIDLNKSMHADAQILGHHILFDATKKFLLKPLKQLKSGGLVWE